MDVGANSETDYGLYFQWGDTQGYTADQVGSGEGKKAFKWADYKYNNNGITKYNTTDGKTVLDPEDDAVAVNWGGSWKMPTKTQFQELLANCTNTWTTVNGVNGRLFTSTTNGNTLFLPAAGNAFFGNPPSVGSSSFIWCSSTINNPEMSDYLFFNAYSISLSLTDRCSGCPVRGVVG